MPREPTVFHCTLPHGSVRIASSAISSTCNSICLFFSATRLKSLITIDIRLTCYTMGIQFELKIYFSNWYHYVVIECHSFHPKKAILMRRQHYEGYEMMVSNANMKRSMLEELLARVIIKWSASSACVEAEIEVLIRVPVPIKAVVYM